MCICPGEKKLAVMNTLSEKLFVILSVQTITTTNSSLFFYNMYNVKSNHADEFIDDSEILDTLAYAEKNKSNRALIEEIIDKAALCKGLTHREAAVLLDCDQPDLIERYEQLAKDVKRRFYGNRLSLIHI